MGGCDFRLSVQEEIWGKAGHSTKYRAGTYSAAANWKVSATGNRVQNTLQLLASKKHKHQEQSSHEALSTCGSTKLSNLDQQTWINCDSATHVPAS